MKSSSAPEYPLRLISVPFQYQIRDDKSERPKLSARKKLVLKDSEIEINCDLSVRRNKRDGDHFFEERDLKHMKVDEMSVSSRFDAKKSKEDATTAQASLNDEASTAIDHGLKTDEIMKNDDLMMLSGPDGNVDSENLPNSFPKDLLLTAAQQILGTSPGGTVTPNTCTTVGSTATTSSTSSAANEIVEETLPLSPLASPGITTPRSDDEEMQLDNVGHKEVALSSQEDANDLFSAVKTELSPICYRNLLFQLVSHMNRSELSDLSTLLRDNLKRDFIKSLPLEIALKILMNLSFLDISHCLQTCKSWNQLINSTPHLWKQMLISESFVSRKNFSKYSQKLHLKYPQVSKNEDAYQLDFLENCHILQNWYNPKFKPQRTTLRGHLTSVVTCLQFEDDYVITGADDKVIRVYDADKKQFLLELTGHDGGVWALKYDDDGILVSGSTDRSVRVWDIKRGCCTHVFRGHTSTVRCLDIVEYRNVKYIVTGSRDNTLHVWELPKEPRVDVPDKQEWPVVYNIPEENPYFVGVLRGHMASVRTVSGHGNIIISGSYDNNLMVWDIAQMKCLYILTGHTDRIYSTIYDHKRLRCISASMDTTIRVWDLQNVWNNGTCSVVSSSLSPCTKITGSMSTLQGHTALVGLLRLSEKFLVSAAADGSLRGWDSNDYSRKFAYHHSNQSAITTFYISDNLLVSGSEGQFNVYNLRSGQLIHSNILQDAEQIWSVNFKGNILVAAVEKDRQSYVEMLDFGQESVPSKLSNSKSLITARNNHSDDTGNSSTTSNTNLRFM